MVFYNILSAISIVVVVFQIVFRVIPWFYENFVGPALCGSSIKLRSMGSWACKFLFAKVFPTAKQQIFWSCAEIQ